MRGPRPKYQPVFSSRDLEQARKVARQRAAPHHHVQRARLAVLLAEQPDLAHGQAAASIGVSVDTVRKWRKRWATGPFCWEDHPRSGRPRTFSPGAGR